MIADEEAHQLPGGTWYHHQLVGLEVATAAGRDLGRLVQVLERPANDVWALSLSGSPTWAQLAPAGTPPGAWYGHSAIYDPARDRMVVFGGNDGGKSAIVQPCRRKKAMKGPMTAS